MAFSRVGGTKNTAASGTSIAVTRSVTAGNLLIAWGGGSGGGGDTPTISDTVNSWTQITTSPLNDGVANNTLAWWWAIAATTASITVTISNFTSGGVGLGAFVEEWSGQASSPADGGNKKTNTAGTTATDGETTGSVTTTSNGDLVISVIYNNNNIRTVDWQTAGTGFTEQATNNDPGGASNITWSVETQIQTSAGAINPSWTAASTDTYIGMTAAFKVPAAAGTGFGPLIAGRRNYIVQGRHG